jgi:hypothetical protein
MKKVEIVNSTMCYQTLVCGPVVDPELTRDASGVYTLEEEKENI